MRFTVNENCIGCGLCASTCPAVFTMKEDGFAKAKEKDVTGAEREAAEEAADACPAEAIEKES